MSEEQRCSCGGPVFKVCGVCDRAKCEHCYGEDYRDDWCSDCKLAYEEMREAERSAERSD